MKTLGLQENIQDKIVELSGVYMQYNIDEIFGQVGTSYVQEIIRIALAEDEEDLTSNGIFTDTHSSKATLISRQDTYVVGLPLIDCIFKQMNIENAQKYYSIVVEEGSFVKNNTIVANFEAPTALLLKVERIILNFITHMSGIANLTKEYLKELEGTGVALLDTRKTLPGHRYLEKYAVRMAGAKNHRMHLSHMIMIKNNHVDAAGSITKAVEILRHKYEECPPIVVECRTKEEILEAVSVKPERILLDNMDCSTLAKNLPLIPRDIEAEISGGVSLKTIRELALSSTERPADFISVGRITHSAPIADFSLRIQSL